MRLPYRQLAKLACLAIAAAAVCAILGGFVGRSGAFRALHYATTFVGEEAAPAFATVWGVHTGSYVGGGLGAVVTIAIVVWRRRR